MGRINSKCDLISNLPDNMIENILVHLSLKEAIKTSTLSKRWRYKWITIPQVVFDNSTFGSYKHSQLTHDELLLTIHQVLLLHDGGISKFMLSVSPLGSCPEIDHLICFLSRKSIEEFTLHIFGVKAHKIPLYLFSCLQMRLLCLRQCVLRPPPDFAGFAKLTGINFSFVDLPARFAETFVAKSPLLECLTLYYCTNLDGIDFYAPNLKLLVYLGSRISFVSFRKTPSLKKVSLVFLSQKASNNTWIEALTSLLSVEYLKIGSLFNLDRGVDQWDDPLIAKHISEAKDSLEFSLQKLRSVEISVFLGSISEMEFIGLLLAKSPVLETLHIYHDQDARTTDQKLMVERKMNQFRRASPRAEVIFHECYERWQKLLSPNAHWSSA